MFGVFAVEPDGWAIALGAPLKEAGQRSSRDRPFWRHIAGHLQAAHRLRRKLGTAENPPLSLLKEGEGVRIEWTGHYTKVAHGSEALARPQAVLDPSGRILDAEDDARNADAREALRTSAIALDRAKAKMLRNKNDESVLEEWRALVDGRWSLVDHFDTDGRRLLIARRNVPGTMPIPLLDERERAVLGYRIAGHPLKLIAYEMGFSMGLTSRLLKSAMNKLGLTSTAELAAFALRAAGMNPPRP
jgi:DNA-binding CsgD family transcriptional regulator